MTNIEWVKNPEKTPGITWNPITGCLNHINGLCKGGGFPCYAYKLANTRLKQRYLANMLIAEPRLREQSDYDEAVREQEIEMEVALGDPFYPRFWEERLETVLKGGKPRGIFVCDMGDLFGMGVPEQWTNRVLNHIRACRIDRFYLLTKQPQRLPEFSPFPENCWVGVTATNQQAYDGAVYWLHQIQALVKYISLEPLLMPIHLPNYKDADWVIAGACTGTVKEMSHLFDKYLQLTPMQWGKKWTAQPRIEWVREIVEAADKAEIPVFLKDNLRPLLIPEDCSKPNYLEEDMFWASEKAKLRQEMPG